MTPSDAQRIERLEELHREDVARNVRLTNEVIMLGAECARLRVDAERLEWLLSNTAIETIPNGTGVGFWWRPDNSQWNTREKFLARIDAATAPMRAEKEDGRD